MEECYFLESHISDHEMLGEKDLMDFLCWD